MMTWNLSWEVLHYTTLTAMANRSPYACVGAMGLQPPGKLACTCRERMTEPQYIP